MITAVKNKNNKCFHYKDILYDYLGLECNILEGIIYLQFSLYWRIAILFVLYINYTYMFTNIIMYTS